MSEILKKPGTALLLVGHGSTLNPDSSEPTHAHADLIRERGIFDEVHCCFWKEEPSMREVLASIAAREIYIVPNFISEGYFTQSVIPREFELTGPVTEKEGYTLKYCDPVGSHPRMTEAILHTAQEIAQGTDPAATCLMIAGHGTALNENSARAAKDQVDRINARKHFAEVLPVYMEEPPLVSDWEKLTTQPNVVMVPFFIADGLHSYEDIPVMLGIEQETGKAASQAEVFRRNPYHLRGKTLFYAGAVGTDPMVVDVILDQVRGFDESHPDISVAV